MTTMRAKVRVTDVKEYKDPDGNVNAETVTFFPVGKSDGYPPDGSDEDNTFARWTPSGELKLTIQNPALLGKLPVGSRFYVDFTPAQ